MKLAIAKGRRFTQGLAALLLCGLAVAYWGSFGVGFYFDDAYGISGNPAIRSVSNIPSFFSDPFTLTTVRENVDLRPVLVTTYALNYAVSGNDPWSYHALNLVLHLIAALLVFVLVRDYLWWPENTRGPDGAARLPAAAAALFFALAPINNQALNYMWARSALLCTLLYLAAMLAMMNGRVLGAALLHALALLTKAIALTLPAAFVAYDFLYRDRERHPDFRSWLRDWKELVPPVAPLLAVDLLYLGLRRVMLPPWADSAMHETWVTPWIWCISQWPAFLHYVRIFVWPAGLSVDHDFPYTMNLAEPQALCSLFAIAVWITAALWYSRRFPQVAFATVWFFLTLAPESSFWPLAEVVNDHRPYIATSLGLSLLLAWIVDAGASLAGRGNYRIVMVAATAVLCLGAVIVGNRRTADWRDSDTLWESTVRSSPGNGRAWMNAGIGYFRRGDYAGAHRYFDRARQLAPAYPYLYMNVVALDLAEGRVEDAVTAGQQAVRFGGAIGLSHYHYGNALERQGRLSDAVAEFRRASELDPNDENSRTALARTSDALAAADATKAEAAMMSEGIRLLDIDHDPERAVEQFQALLQRHPGHYGATYQLARALDAAGRGGEALEIWQKALEMARQTHDTQAEARIVKRLGTRS
ncbi:MAG TPA: tetratricopeptide repeat protein [Candidatus Binatia bacterium]|jgi:tetratricopeptide (TPR) repeat protein